MAFGILFVCTGNICRSPMAVGVMRALVQRRGLFGRVRIDSAGVYDGHVGQEPSILAIEAAARRGYRIGDLKARQIVVDDIEAFELPVAMDRTHLATLRGMARPALSDRPRLLMTFAPDTDVTDVVDPYGGTSPDYERALDLIEAACTGLLDHAVEGVARAA